MASVSTEFRREIIDRARQWAERVDPRFWYQSVSESDPVVLFEPCEGEDGPRHGNFLDESYRAVLSDCHWKQRLDKPHPRRNALPKKKRSTAKELDSCTSSDALLLNVLGHPDSSDGIREVLDAKGPPEFGVGGAIPKRAASGLAADTSELDLVYRGGRGRLSLIVEAKLTEPNFTTKPLHDVEAYASFESVFDGTALKYQGDRICDYQLIRNVLAAHYHGSRFRLLYDARRTDLRDRFDAVVVAIRHRALARRVGAITWQRLASACAPDLQEFLAEKYGIVGQ